LFAGTSSAANHFLSWQRADAAAPYLALFLVGVRFRRWRRGKLRQHVFQALLRLASIRDLNRECLAWSGIRNVLSAERAVWSHQVADAFESALECSYAALGDKDPAVATLATEVRSTPPPTPPDATCVTKCAASGSRQVR